jgi:hypothetical protein
MITAYRLRVRRTDSILLGVPPAQFRWRIFGQLGSIYDGSVTRWDRAPAYGGRLLRSPCRDPLLINVHLVDVLAEDSANS